MGSGEWGVGSGDWKVGFRVWGFEFGGWSLVSRRVVDRTQNSE